MRPSTPNLNFAHLVDPSSPPATPVANSFRFASSTASAATAAAVNSIKTHGVARPTQQSALQDGLRPIGQGPHFSYTRSTKLGNLSPRSSTTSSEDESDDEDEDEEDEDEEEEEEESDDDVPLQKSTLLQPELSEGETDKDEDSSSDSSDDELDREDLSSEDSGSDSDSASDDDDELPHARAPLPAHRSSSPRPRIVSHGNFTLTELAPDDDRSHGSDAGLEVMRPDYEDAESDYRHSSRRSTISISSSDTEETDQLAAELRNLDCVDRETLHDEYIRQHRARKRANRLSSGSLKRPHAESWGSEKDENEHGLAPDMSDFSQPSRRMRRRTNRGSIFLDDPPIVEEREPPGSVNGDISDPLLDPYTEQGQSVDRELPYYVEEAMQID